MRQATERAVRSLERYDFDVGGTLYDGKPIKAVDCGDVPGNLWDHKDHFARAETAVRKILAAGALPIVIGGDHAIPIPVLRAYEGRGPITLVQIDAHIDWREDVNGVREGLSSPIRRASEMSHIAKIFQIGIRAQGSARTEEVEAALAYGSNIITAYELHDVGMDAVLARIPDGGNYYLTIDADGMDPAAMPAVAGPGAGRRHLPSGPQADPRPRQEGARGRHGHRRDHAAARRQPHHLHHGRTPDRQPDRRRRQGRLLRCSATRQALGWIPPLE